MNDYELIVGKLLTPEMVRVARGEVHLALSKIRSRSLDRNECVHEVRKHCKKIRALLRLFRPELDITYEIENAWFRDIARELSWIRDAQALLESCDELSVHIINTSVKRANQAVRAACSARLTEITKDKTEINKQLRKAGSSFRRALERMPGWSLQGRERAAITGGLQRTYRQGQRAMRLVLAQPTAENFHEWRKHAKYHWYHLRLIRAAWPEVMDGMVAVARQLGQALGKHHDIEVLKHTLETERDRFALGPATKRRYIQFLDKRQGKLGEAAKTLGSRIYIDKPSVVAGRYVEYWFA